MPHASTLPLWEKRIPGHVRLALAVVGQVWLDAYVSTDAALNNTDRTRYPDDVRGEARRWLIFETGPWREDRQFWCDCAGVSETKLRKAAKRRLKLVKREERTATVIALDRAFATLLETAESMAPEALDSALAELAALESAAA